MRRIEIEISVDGTAEELIADIQEASASLRDRGVQVVLTEMLNETVPYSGGQTYPVLRVYGTTRRRA